MSVMKRHRLRRREGSPVLILKHGPRELDSSLGSSAREGWCPLTVTPCEMLLVLQQPVYHKSSFITGVRFTDG